MTSTVFIGYFWFHSTLTVVGIFDYENFIPTNFLLTHEGALTSLSDMLLLRKRVIIETINDELKNIAQVEHSRYRSFDNFIVNTLGAIAAYCMSPKKTCIKVKRTWDTQPALF